jgi:hypothetical protein
MHWTHTERDLLWQLAVSCERVRSMLGNPARLTESAREREEFSAADGHLGYLLYLWRAAEYASRWRN